MLDLGPQIIKAMNLIEDAQKAGVLLGPDKIVAKDETNVTLIKEAAKGKTSHPCFEQLVAHPMTYRLKPNVSASFAIKDLLSSFETFVECGVALNICYYLVIMWQMEEAYGWAEGCQRFDQIFGEEHNATPESLRLIISPSPFVNGARALPGTHKPLVDPLSFLSSSYVILSHKDQIQVKAQIGDLLIFNGDPNYLKIHPFGSNATHNCIITSLHPLKVRTFNLGKEERSENDLYEQHKTAYSQSPSLASLSLLDKKFKYSEEFHELLKKPTNNSKIQGFMNIIVRVDNDKLKFLISGNTETVKKQILAHQANVLTNMQALNIKTTNLNASIKNTRNSKQEDVQGANTPLFSGLDGLKGAFVKTNNKPVSKETNSVKAVQNNTSTDFAGLEGLRGAFHNVSISEPAKNPVLIPTTVTNEPIKKQDNYLGFSSGFLNTIPKQPSKEPTLWATGKQKAQDTRKDCQNKM